VVLRAIPMPPTGIASLLMHHIDSFFSIKEPILGDKDPRIVCNSLCVCRVCDTLIESLWLE
jgi:hypothetical protein